MSLGLWWVSEVQLASPGLFTLEREPPRWDLGWNTGWSPWLQFLCGCPWGKWLTIWVSSYRKTAPLLAPGDVLLLCVVKMGADRESLGQTDVTGLPSDWSQGTWFFSKKLAANGVGLRGFDLAPRSSQRGLMTPECSWLDGSPPWLDRSRLMASLRFWERDVPQKLNLRLVVLP